jgi:RNA polymerase sigma-70 factor (ECF subfamily)
VAKTMVERQPSGADLTLAANGGDLASLGAAIVDHYPELRRIAQGLLRREGRAMTLQPTALVHEAVVRLLDGRRLTTKGNATFRGFFAHVCRNILVEQARARHAQKRGGDRERHTLVTGIADLGLREPPDLLAIDELLQKLAVVDQRLARVVEMRVFAEMTVADCAEALGVSERTVHTDWRLATEWLQRAMGTS